MKFVVEEQVFERFPALRIALAVTSGVDNTFERESVAVELKEAWKATASLAEFGSAQSQPRVAAWREAMRSVGVSHKDFPTSIEALVRRAMKQPEPVRINPVVDFYHSVCLHHLVPAGGFDLRQLQGSLQLRITRGGEPFHALGSSEAVLVEPNEIAYTDDQEVLTRHFVWRQACRGLVQAETTDVVLVSEVLGALEDDVAGAVLAHLVDGIREHFHVSALGFVLDINHATAEWN